MSRLPCYLSDRTEYSELVCPVNVSMQWPFIYTYHYNSSPTAPPTGGADLSYDVCDSGDGSAHVRMDLCAYNHLVLIYN